MKSVTNTVVFVSLIVLFNKCNNAGSAGEEGRLLASKYCQGCHMLPSPEALDKKTWEAYVLPKMGGYLGFQRLPTGGYVEKSAAEMLTLREWTAIVNYFITISPDTLKQRPPNHFNHQLPGFKTEMMAFPIDKPSITLVSINDSAGGFFLGDGFREQLYRFDKTGRLIDSSAAGRGVTHVHAAKHGWYVLSMGVLHPSDAEAGKLLYLNDSDGSTQVVIDSLQRPVHASYHDLDNDGDEDIVVCEFGNETGRLTWYEAVNKLGSVVSNRKGSGKSDALNRIKKNNQPAYRAHVLRAFPGAVKTVITDMNRDGQPDVVALMAQGDEGIFVYYNEGNRKFREERLLRFPPFYGCNYFEMVDINHDGHPDILLTNGDNGDYPPILKSYHGIRLYFNDGKNGFDEQDPANIFLPLYGASKAVAGDFDRDGDIDLASISYFPDYVRKPEEAFVYWQNQGSVNFSPHTFSAVGRGRWLTMDAGDVDGDGDQDIILGNATFPLGNIPPLLKMRWDTTSLAGVLLRNKLN